MVIKFQIIWLFGLYGTDIYKCVTDIHATLAEYEL